MKQQGVTLIQMMFALGMAALLTQLGMPAYARLSDDLHRAAAARDLAQALRSARSHALLQGQPVLVQPLENDWGKGWRVLLERNQQVLREQRLSRSLKIVGNTRGDVKFSALGVPLRTGNQWTSATLKICEPTSATSQIQVVLASSGRVDLRTEKKKDPLCAGP
ncbi:GspH/FimT family pseudopilin [Pseudomonas plecoglossicida]|uniref:Type II secretion system protein H n=1 Tax=Pseudomonas plecoglossicida TaxID=70775 RepID=A0AAD0QZ71_PSEDL|nr:GspH/FimT family protein [Pseudomonas plecoglossicida]AXM97765.1 type IV pili biogenesis protein FimT [Pseudomonas plecoglossicida]QLB53905.1 type IV pili biogenesis protein FimT [Pseudomonas plecoglossicida]GLR35818.1 general secretion pathway protein GspH [Pseudomonas plecoglossicida]